MADVDNGNNEKKKQKRGRKPFIMDTNYRARLRGAVLGKVAPSYRSLVRKFECNDHTIKQRIASLGIKKKKRRRIPKVTLTQKITQWYRLQRFVESLHGEFSDADFIQDDESYFKLSDDTHNKWYFTENEDEDETVRCIRKTKFEKKVLVWVAISPRGASRMLVHLDSKQAVNASFYSKFCIKQRLVPMIKKLYADGKYLFVPDNASSHYAQETLGVYEENQIRFLDQQLNPPNMPQIRPIETFWAHLKRKVYSGGWTARNQITLKKRILKVFKDFPTEYFTRLFENTRARIFEAAQANREEKTRLRRERL